MGACESKATPELTAPTRVPAAAPEMVPQGDAKSAGQGDGPTAASKVSEEEQAAADWGLKPVPNTDSGDEEDPFPPACLVPVVVLNRRKMHDVVKWPPP